MSSGNNELIKEMNKIFSQISSCEVCKHDSEILKNKLHLPSEWSTTHHWAFWAPNPFPTEKRKYYTLYHFNPVGRPPPKLILVGLNPSSGLVPSKNDMVFARALIELKIVREKFEWEKVKYQEQDSEKETFIYYETEVLITDLYNCIIKGELKNIPRKCFEHLIKQIEVIDKYIKSTQKLKIVPIGQKVMDWLKSEVGNKYEITNKIYHYGGINRIKKFRGNSTKYIKYVVNFLREYIKSSAT